MAIGDDWSIDSTNRRLYHSSGTTRYSVQNFFSWLMDRADDVDLGPIAIPMAAPSAQQYRLINGWFIPFDDFKYLTGYNAGTKDGGSVITVGHARVVDTTTGVVRIQRTGSNIVAGDIGNAITHADGDAGVLLDVSGTYLYVRPNSSAAANNFDSTSGNLTCNGHVDVQAAAGVSGESLWTNLYTIGSDDVISNITLYLEQDGVAVDVSDISYGYTTGHIDLLIQVRDCGTLIDSGNVTVLAREWGYTYDYYVSALVNGGRLPAPVAVAVDSNNTTLLATVAAYNIDVAHGSYTEDVTGDGADENYEAQIDLNSSHSVLDAYEYTKWLTRRGSVTTVDGVQGQLYKTADSAYAVVKANPFGSFAGGKFFGARGVYFLLTGRPAAQANLYELIDSDGTIRVEPTLVTVQVTATDGVGPDLVFVARRNVTDDLLDDQYTTAGSGNSTSSSTVTIVETPDGDTPSSGVIRLQGKRYTYSSYSGSVFTLDVGDWPTGLEEDNNSVDAYVPYLDQFATGATVSVGIPYSADRDILYRVRQYGMIPYEGLGEITSNGYAVQVNRVTDEVVT